VGHHQGTDAAHPGIRTAWVVRSQNSLFTCPFVTQSARITPFMHHTPGPRAHTVQKRLESLPTARRLRARACSDPTPLTSHDCNAACMVLSLSPDGGYNTSMQALGVMALGCLNYALVRVPASPVVRRRSPPRCFPLRCVSPFGPAIETAAISSSQALCAAGTLLPACCAAQPCASAR